MNDDEMELWNYGMMKMIGKIVFSLPLFQYSYFPFIFIGK